MATSPTVMRNTAMRTLIGACIGMFLNPSSLLMLSFGVYLIPIVADTGWEKAFIASAIGPVLIIVGLMPPVIGWLTSRFGPRRFMSVAFPLCGAGLMLLSTPTSATAFAWTLVLCGLMVSGQIMVPYVHAVSGWFDERRGSALGLILAATGLGVAVIPPVAAQLIALLGWRGALLAIGAVVFVAGLVVPRWLIVDPPVVAAVDRSKVPGLPWRAALRQRSMGLLMASLLLIGSAVSAGTINLYGILVDRGVAPVQASLVMTCLGLSMIGARLVVGYLFDRLRPQFVAMLIGVIVAMAFLVLATTSGPAGVIVAAILMGIGFGAEGDAMSYLTSRAFGMRDFGTIFGIVFLSFTMGGALGPVVFARMTAAGLQETALWGATACCVLGTMLIAQLRAADLPYARQRASASTVAAQTQASNG